MSDERVKIRVEATSAIWRPDALILRGTRGTVVAHQPFTVEFDEAVRVDRKVAGVRTELNQLWVSLVGVEPVAGNIVAAPEPWTPRVGDYVRLKKDPSSIRRIVEVGGAVGGNVKCLTPHHGACPWGLLELEPWRPEIGETVRVKATGHAYEVAGIMLCGVEVKSGRGHFLVNFDAIEPVGVPEPKAEPEPPKVKTTKVPAAGQRVRRNSDGKEGTVRVVHCYMDGGVAHVKFDNEIYERPTEPRNITPIGDNPRFITIEESA